LSHHSFENEITFDPTRTRAIRKKLSREPRPRMLIAILCTDKL